MDYFHVFNMKLFIISNYTYTSVLLNKETLEQTNVLSLTLSTFSKKRQTLSHKYLFLSEQQRNKLHFICVTRKKKRDRNLMTREATHHKC